MDKTKLFFPLIIYILRARYIFEISGEVPRVWGRKREKREKDGFSGVPGGLSYRRIPVSRTGGTGRPGRRKQHGDSAGVGYSGTAAAFLTAFSVLDKGCPGEIQGKRISWQRQTEGTSTPEEAGVSTEAVQFQGK